MDRLGEASYGAAEVYGAGFKAWPLARVGARDGMRELRIKASKENVS